MLELLLVSFGFGSDIIAKLGEHVNSLCFCYFAQRMRLQFLLIALAERVVEGEEGCKALYCDKSKTCHFCSNRHPRF